MLPARAAADSGSEQKSPSGSRIQEFVGREVLLQPRNVVDTNYAVEKTAVPGLVESGAIYVMEGGLFRF